MNQTLLANRYRLERMLGQGGMGQVHLAHDTLLERRVAVKMPPAGIERDGTTRTRFRREALAAAALDHPFICKIHEVGEHDGRDFIVMEYIEGRTLDAVARDGGLSPRELLDVAHEIAQALDEAHRRGVVHRDLKPSNIMLTVQGHVKVLDFGLAKQVVAAEHGHETQAGALTDPGTRLGTPAYMSPEQILGSPLDPRSDVFSLGVVLHELASGRHPFTKDHAGETMASILRDPPASTIGDLDVVPGFGGIVHRMLAKACAERFQSMSELRAALDELRSGRSSSSSSSGTSGVSPAREERNPFVSRDSELAELSAAIDRMLLGQGSFILLGGEPGVGKTRLARETQRLARARGCLVLTGQCYEQEGAPPFGPFVEIIEYGARVLPQAARLALGDSAAEIASIVPSLRRTYHDIPPASVVPADQQRRLLFNAYLEYMQRVAQKSAIVVLFDDLHWADESSLQLLLHIAPHLHEMRALVIGTYRDVELDTVRPFARTLETLLRQRLATRINLKRLTAAGVEQMLSTMSGASPPSSLVRIVYEETDGNPFFVEEVFHHLAEEGKLFEPDGQWKQNLRADQIDVPEGVRLVVSRRLERLGEAARKVLTAGAVIGRSFPLDLLIAVAQESEDAILDVVEETERAQLVVSERGRQPRYTFVHELIRSTLVSAMALPRRQRLHLRVADAIERLRAAALDAHISMLAHHLYQAGAAVEPDRAIKFLLLAAKRSQDSGAYEETLELCDQLASFEPASDSSERAVVEEIRGRSLLSLSRLDESIGPARRAMAIYVARQDDAGIVRAAASLGEALIWQGKFSETIAVCHRALAALSPAADKERCQVQAGVAGWLTGDHRFAEAQTMLEAAMATAERLGEPNLRGSVLSGAANLARQLGRVTEAIDLSRRALALLHESEKWERTQAWFTLTLNLYYAGRFEELPAAFDQTRTAAARAHHGGAMWVVRRCEQGMQLWGSGNLEAFRSTVQHELQFPIQWPFVTKMTLAIADFYLGRTTSALDMMRGVIDEQPPKTWVDCLPHANLFAMHAWSGSDAIARRLLPDLEPRLAKAGEMNQFGQWLAVAAAVGGLALLDDRQACAALYPAACDLIESGLRVETTSLGPNTPQLTAAIAAEAAGADDKARDHFEQALVVAADLQSRLHQPMVQLWFGRYLAARADADSRARGVTMLTEAAAAFSRLAMIIHQQHARRWLGDVRA